MKKQHYFLFWTWLFAFALSLPLHAQTQLGADINGEAEGDQSGISVSLSADGTILAIGADEDTGNGDEAGYVRVYQWNGATWGQLGADINGEAEDDNSGTSVSLSADGTILAIGSPDNGGFGTGKGRVRVYQWNGTAWVRLGADIDGEAAGDRFGYSVSLSADGTRLAIGAYLNDGTGGTATDAGHVRVYQWNGTAWIQQGGDIDGEAAADISGRSVSLSADGTRLAIGATLNDGNGNRAGHVRVYQWNSTTMAWQQQGLDIDGEAANDNFGRSVSLSADGTRLATGSAHAGYVQVYQWNGTAWVQQGVDINGSLGFGESISLSADGTRLAIGASSKPLPTGGGQAGQVQVYQWNGTTWAQLGVDLYGEAANDHFGTSVSLSADGSRVAIGAPDNDGSGDGAGHVRVYEACPRVATTTETMTWNGSSNTDWNTPCNWSPNGVPTATNPVEIPDVTNDPVVPTSLAAVTKSIIFQAGNPNLTVQSNATLTVTGTVVNLKSATITNAGTISTTGFRSENTAPLASEILTFLNQSTGVVNGSFFTSGGIGGSLGGVILTNHGTINYSGSGLAIYLSHYNSQFYNYGTINVTGGQGINLKVDNYVNYACAKILVSAGVFRIDNYGGSRYFINHGLVQVAGTLSVENDYFTNYGVVKYGTLEGIVKNVEGIIVNDALPIFSYGSSSLDVVNGIFTNVAATTSAGTFTAPNTFVPSGLPAGSQTLYAKITPSGGACSYVVPFTYNNVAKKLFVKADAAGANNGASWTDALTNLQSALAIAITGDEIWVAKGTYKPTADGSGNTTPTNPRDKTFLMKDGVKLYGSFAGTETDLSQRTPAVMAANPAILSGDFGDNDVVAGSGITGNGENAYHVVVVAFANNTSTAYLDGFTITGGNANANCCGSVTINGRIIFQFDGGGIVIINGTNTLSNNTITGNRASGTGGGIDNTASNTTLTNNTITGNSAVLSGGGIYTIGSNTTLTNNTIIGNLTSGNGGGIINRRGNHTLTNNTITGNRASSTGGGIYSDSGSNTTLTNNTISGNSARSGGGIYSDSDANNTLTNNTIIGNNADYGGGIYIDGITTITNTIIWGNTRLRTIIDNVSNSGTLTITYSIVQGGYTGTGNKNQDPLFVNAADIDGADNIHRTADDGLLLLACSPAVNAGNNAGIPSGITSDITGMDRFFNTTVDMGAYELRANPSVVPTITLGTIPTICAGATSFTIPYTATTGTPTTYSISGTGITAVTDATLPTGAITVNLSAAASGTAIPFTLTVKNASGCASAEITGSVTVNAAPTATISYTGSPFCKSAITGAVTITGATGGTFSSTAGLTIDATTGEINPSTSTAGTYTVTYAIAASGGCAAVNATASVTIANCVNIIYVNAANTNPTQNGTSWSTAFSQLTAGLSAAAAVSGVSVEVWVAQGTYKPGTLRRDVFTIPSGVKVYGGFVGNETQLSARDWKTHKTLLSGEIGSAQRSDNTYHVVSFSATNDQTQLDGFHIEKAFGDFFTGNQSAILDAPNFQQSGGGILAINKSKGAVSNCVISDNKATFGGGILLRDSSQLLIAQTVIWGNEATFGGGVYVLGGSKPRFENTLIVANKGLGGGFYVNASQPTLIHCTLASNLGTNGTAGGIFNSNATTTLKNSILWGNSAPQSTNGSVITYSIIEGGFAGTGNRNANPRFVSASPSNLAMMTALGDYHLLNCSPAIDAANNPDGLSQDLDGNTRPVPSAVGIADMGAYESSGSNGSGPATLTLTAPITSGTVLQAAGQLTATNQISGATVVYQGSQSVTLLPGFSANGNTFQALIGDCGTTAVSSGEVPSQK